MLHLLHCTHLSLHNSSFSINKPKRLIFLSGFSVNGDNKLLGLKKIRRYAVDKDSEFEVDPDKAREALRKLDEQFPRSKLTLQRLELRTLIDQVQDKMKTLIQGLQDHFCLMQPLLC